jgi:myotubularin-related protein 1/2
MPHSGHTVIKNDHNGRLQQDFTGNGIGSNQSAHFGTVNGQNFGTTNTFDQSYDHAAYVEKNSIILQVVERDAAKSNDILNPNEMFPLDEIPQNVKRQVFHHTLIREFLIYLRTQQFYVAYFNASQKTEETMQNFQKTYKQDQKYNPGCISVSNNAIGITNSKVFIVPESPTSSGMTYNPINSIPENGDDEDSSKNTPTPPKMNSPSNPHISPNPPPSPTHSVIEYVPLEFSLETIFLIYADMVRLIATLRNTRINGLIMTAPKNIGGNAFDTSIKVASLAHYLSTFESIFENKHIACLGRKGYEEYGSDDFLTQTRGRVGTNIDTSNNQIGQTSVKSGNVKHAKQLYIQAEYQRLLSNFSPSFGLLIGEELYFTSECGVEIPVFSSNSAQGLQPHQTLVPGKLRITNYRIIITPHDPLFDKIDIPNFTILKFQYSTSSSMGKGSAAYPTDTTLIDVDTKELQRKLRVYIDGQGILPILEMVKRHAFTENPHDAFAFKYKLGLISMQNTFNNSLSAVNNNPSQLPEKEREHYQLFKNLPIHPQSPNFIDGWTIYDQKLEYQRQGLPLSPTKFSYVENTDYLISPTYPATLVVPTALVNHIYEVCEHRSRGRYPMVVYYHKLTNTTISRCSQPLVGLGGKASPQDVQLLSSIRTANTSNSRLLHIFDCRPYRAAMANKLGGKGMEKMSHYERTKLTYLNIDNIHAMTSSYAKLHEACSPTFINQSEINYQTENFNSTYLNKIVESKWLHYLALILTSTVRIVQTITEEKCSVVIHCSDGWDRTAQISSLVQILLDPYFRTIVGFCVLIEKEFCAMGHQFQERIGHGQINISSQRSPVFVQFIDCVFQILHQYPTIFEFNSDFLVHIVESMYSCRYGTFLFNSQRERVKYELHNTTVSLWTELLNIQNRHLYYNPQYKKTKENKTYFPDSSGSRLVLFDKLHLRYAPHMKTMVEEMEDHPGSYQPGVQIK